jgi:hypothetical protein
MCLLYIKYCFILNIGQGEKLDIINRYIPSDFYSFFTVKFQATTGINGNIDSGLGIDLKSGLEG